MTSNLISFTSIVIIFDFKRMSFWSNWVGGWGASSRFEKHRLLFTNKGDLGPIN